MNRSQDFRRYVEIGQAVAACGAKAARRVTAQVSAEAARGVEIAKPIVREASRKAWTEAQRPAVAARPVVEQAARQAITATVKTSRQAYKLIRQGAKHRAERAVPLLHDLSGKLPKVNRVVLAGAASLLGAAVLGGVWLNSPSVTTASTPQVMEVVEQDVGHPEIAEPVQPVEETPEPVEVATSITELVPAVERTPTPSLQEKAQAQRQAELESLRQQARNQLEQAAADYEYALQNWNEEVAACQSGGMPAGYTSHQMGQLAAMGYRPQMQPQRQPNQALYHSARQAEQRYLTARNNYQQLMAAN